MFLYHRLSSSGAKASFKQYYADFSTDLGILFVFLGAKRFFLTG